MTDKEVMQMALDALVNAKGYIFHNVLDDTSNRYDIAIEAIRTRLSQCERCGETNQAEIHTCSPQEPVLQDIEQYRLQMAAISTAAIGYWKEGDGILPDYDTPALRDVAKLYSKYEALYATPPQREWQGLTDEDCEEIERWVEFKEDGSGRIPTLKLIRYIEAKLKEKNT